MIDREAEGKIVNIAAVSALMALRPLAAYNSSKGGVISLTKSLATEWARHGINVNAVAPTFIQTPLTKGLLADDDSRDFLTQTDTSGPARAARRHRRRGGLSGLLRRRIWSPGTFSWWTGAGLPVKPGELVKGES